MQRIALWSYTPLLLVVMMLLPGLLGHDYPEPFRWYLQLSLLAILCGVQAFRTLHLRAQNAQRAKDDRAEYRRLRGSQDH
jgi:hypothetical protein